MSYLYCERGHPDCLDQNCMCIDTRHYRKKFVKARSFMSEEELMRHPIPLSVLEAELDRLRRLSWVAPAVFAALAFHFINLLLFFKIFVGGE